MSKLELDDQILNHRKFKRAVRLGSSESIHMWLGIRAYVGQNLTDGFVPADELDEVGGPTNAKKRADTLRALKDAGLLHDVVSGSVPVSVCERCSVVSGLPDGVLMHDYLDWSTARDVLIERREKAKVRKRVSRGPSHGVSRRDIRSDIPRDGQRDEHGTGDGTDDGTPRVVTPLAGGPAPARGDSLSGSDSDSLSAHPTRARPLPDNFGASLVGPDDLLPADWAPDAANIALAARLGLNLDDEAAEFAAHRRRDRVVCGNWPADFELWLRRSKKFSRDRRPPGALAHASRPPAEDLPPAPAHQTFADQERAHATRLAKALAGDYGPKLAAKAADMPASQLRAVVERLERGRPTAVGNLLAGVGRAAE